jgi:hypothetical protein
VDRKPQSRRKKREAIYEQLRADAQRFPSWVRRVVERSLDQLLEADAHNSDGSTGRPRGKPTRRSDFSFEELVTIRMHDVRTGGLGDDGTGCQFFERHYGCNQRLISQIRHEEAYADVRREAALRTAQRRHA